MSRTLLLAFILAAPNAWGQDESLTYIEKWERFRLWSYCRPVLVLEPELSTGTAEIGLNEGDVMVAVRSRLRSARIYTEDYGNNVGQLRIIVRVAGEAFRLDIEYRKRLSDSASGETLFTTTWETGATGTHGQDSIYITSALSQGMDLFIDEYLRVNEEACLR